MADTAGNPWDSALNAEAYDGFVRENGVYAALGRELVQRAEVDSALRVLDLACGTGAATEAALATLPADGEVVAMDASAEMVSVARAQIADPRVRFEVAPAADLARVAAGPVDRVVCNAAFWHFPAPRPVLRAVAQVLDPVGGVLAFNVSAALVRGEAAPLFPFQVTLTQLIEEASGGTSQGQPVEVDPAALDQVLAEEGFEPAEQWRYTYRCAQRELMDLLEVPALLEPLTPELDPPRREEVLREARRRSDPGAPVEVPWIGFRTRLAAPTAAGSTR